MLTIYKKVEKSTNNLTGIIEVTSIDELDKPFLLCLSAQNNNDKSIYGIIREGAQAARVYTSQEVAAGFKIDEMPVDFLGVRFKSDDNYQFNYQEIVEKLVYPYLMKHGRESVLSQALNMNFMTFCDGTFTYANIEKALEEKLRKDNFSEEEIAAILKNISLVAIATMADTSTLKCTSVTLIDINDQEIEYEKTNSYRKMLQHQERDSGFGITRNNNLLYIFRGTGSHSIKEYLSNNSMAKPILCSVISSLLESSINQTEKKPLEELREYSVEAQSIESLLHKLDSKLSYCNTPKYTKEEAQMRRQLDESYKLLTETMKKLQYTMQEKEKANQQLTSLTEKIQDFSSETTYYQILISAGLWQPGEENDPFDKPSDKEVRELYKNQEQLLNK